MDLSAFHGAELGLGVNSALSVGPKQCWVLLLSALGAVRGAEVVLRFRYDLFVEKTQNLVLLLFHWRQDVA